MNRRNLLASVVLGLALVASPAMAKKKPAPAPATPPLVIAVDTNPANDPDNVLVLDLSNGGRVLIRLVPAWAPNHVERIKTLTKSGFYNGIIFHRVIEGFMAQTGDPTGTGQGGSQLPNLNSEFNLVPHMRGSVSMARTEDPNSANSQFFIVFYPRFALDRRYTNFGRVIGGMEWVDTIEKGEPPANPTKIIQASLGSEGKPKPVYVAPAAPVTPPSLTGLQPLAPATPVAPAKPVVKPPVKPRGK